MSDGRPVAVVLVGIGEVAVELLRAAERVLGPLGEVGALGFAPDAAPEQVRARLRDVVTASDRGGGVLMVADLCGSTLANACYGLAAERAGYDVLCGMNLAMLMKLFSLDRETLDATAVARALADTGRQGIRLYSETAAPALEGSDER